jgi:DNA-binding NarL/FixJ family response regulator
MPEIQQLSPMTKIMVLSASPTAKEAISAIRAGAQGYCSHKISADYLDRALTAILRNELWAERMVVSELIEQLISSNSRASPNLKTSFEGLNAPQREVVDLVRQGAGNKQIASQLNISEATVKARLTRIFRRLGISGRLELALLKKS